MRKNEWFQKAPGGFLLQPVILSLHIWRRKPRRSSSGRSLSDTGIAPLHSFSITGLWERLGDSGLFKDLSYHTHRWAYLHLIVTTQLSSLCIERLVTVAKLCLSEYELCVEGACVRADSCANRKSPGNRKPRRVAHVYMSGWGMMSRLTDSQEDKPVLQHTAGDAHWRTEGSGFDSSGFAYYQFLVQVHQYVCW